MCLKPTGINRIRSRCMILIHVSLYVSLFRMDSARRCMDGWTYYGIRDCVVSSFTYDAMPPRRVLLSTSWSIKHSLCNLLSAVRNSSASSIDHPALSSKSDINLNNIPRSPPKLELEPWGPNQGQSEFVDMSSTTNFPLALSRSNLQCIKGMDLRVGENQRFEIKSH